MQMKISQKRRLWIVIIGLHFAALIVLGRLIAFQIIQGAHWKDLGEAVRRVNVIAQPERGIIYDRNGAVLAANSADYQIGASPNLIVEADEIATALAPILQTPRAELLNALTTDKAYVLLSGRVSNDVAEAVRALPYSGLQIDPLPRRVYPQGELMCHILGYTDFDGLGGIGLEGYYQSELAGEAASDLRSISPLTPQNSVIAREGADLVLTIDRSIQFMVEQKLQQALIDYGASDGSIIVMDVRTGAIHAMASTPCFDPYKFYTAAEDELMDPIISQQYEPGSVIKLVTLAAALDSGTVSPRTTYYDAGMLEVGGHLSYNWDRSAPGTTDMQTMLTRSLNVGTATVATWMGADTYYNYMERFNFGRPTGIDLMAEASGTLHMPGSELWTESFLATNSYGQGIAVTPIQMITAIGALANEGYLMKPYLVQEIRRDGEVYVHEPTVISRPISRETANMINAMAISVVNDGVQLAQMDGYTVAGKTGTAQIPENGVYLEDVTIGSFIGWLPADDPELIILVKLDRPTTEPWGSLTAAPVFADLAKELVVMLNIPPDSVRLQADIVEARGN
jgi:cell division protein FtsI/penicillin-binding protein 2